MSLRNNKKDVLTSIAAYTSLGQQRDTPETNDTFSSLNETDNGLGFLMDVLRVVMGSEGIKRVIGELFGDFIGETEILLKDTLKSQTTDYNSNEQLPNNIQGDGDGLYIPVKDIDSNSQFKTPRDDDVGDLLYGKNQDNFDNKAYDAIENEPTEEQYGNLLMEYDSTTESFKCRSTETGQTVGDWCNDFIDNTTFLEKDKIISGIFDGTHGTLSKNQNKTVNDIFVEKQTDKILENMIDNKPDISLSSDDLTELYDQAENTKKGLQRHYIGCDVVFLELPLKDLEGIVDNILGTTDPFEISNQIEGVLDKTTTEETEEQINENKETVKDGFLSFILNLFRRQLIKMAILSPQVRILMAIFMATKHGGEYQKFDSRKFLEDNQVFIRCIIEKLSSKIIEFIYKLCVNRLLKLLTPIIRHIIREKIMAYINIIKSLITR